jgi:hypothetical protein
MAWLAEHFAGKEVTYTVYTLKGGTKVFPSYVDWIWEVRCRKCGEEVLLARQGCLVCALPYYGECTEEVPSEIKNNYRCDRWAHECGWPYFEPDACEKKKRKQGVGSYEITYYGPTPKEDK